MGISSCPSPKNKLTGRLVTKEQTARTEVGDA
jgi:hypothetical protein